MSDFDEPILADEVTLRRPPHRSRAGMSTRGIVALKLARVGSDAPSAALPHRLNEIVPQWRASSAPTMGFMPGFRMRMKHCEGPPTLMSGRYG